MRLTKKRLNKTLVALRKSELKLNVAEEKMNELQDLLKDAEKKFVSAKNCKKQRHEEWQVARISCEKARINRYRKRINALSKKYDIRVVIDIDDCLDVGEVSHGVYQPDWLSGDDPLEDGHYSHDWADTLWLVEFYAKHSPAHPDYANREFLEISPHG
tara:strand:- start:3876 stop:4349 length:474 start_codon:yes stop_codon:yes gene_type:complete